MFKWYYQQFGTLILTIVLLVVTFTGLGFIVLSVLVNSNAGQGLNLDYPAANRFEATLVFEGTPDPTAKLDFKDTALGISLNYPRSWQKTERGLDVVFSPTIETLEPASPGDTALWIGIPLDNITSDTELLASLLAQFGPGGRILNRQPIMIGGQQWRMIEINFENETLDGTMMARLAITQRNKVLYYFVAIAPTSSWHTVQPVFTEILNSLRFTEEVVLRPTDATPPPTPTPTPTPVVYVVQPGDTLDYIAALYGVDLEVLTARNGIDDPLLIQTGEKLIIPIRRR